VNSRAISCAMIKAFRHVCVKPGHGSFLSIDTRAPGVAHSGIES
jgi:hypothetical protein